MPPCPIFVLSLPRSGSTLVQRILAAHEGIATASEPWFLLSLLGPLRPDLPLRGEFDQMVSRAVTDFVHELDEGADTYRRDIRTTAVGLYERASPEGTRFFVDKTPPYHMIVDELVATFPDARFLFLWRNPLAVVASIVETLAGGRWSTSLHRGDLFAGVDNLTSAFARHRERALGVRYEDLLAGDEAWRRVADYVGFDLDPAALEQFDDVRLHGRMGDPTGVHRYHVRSAEPLEKWKRTVDTPIRREWCRRWLRWIGRERLGLMGYDLDELFASLDALTVRRGALLDDTSELAVAAVREALGARLPGARFPSSLRMLLSAPAS